MIDRRENIFGFTKFSPTNHPATLSPILSGVSQKQVVVQIQFLNMYLSSVTSDAEQRGWSCSVSSVAFLPTRYSADFFICFVFHASHWCPPHPHISPSVPLSSPGMGKEGLMHRTRHSGFHLPRPNISEHISDTKGSAWLPPRHRRSPHSCTPLHLLFNIGAADEKWHAFVYLPPMQMRPQQD